MSQLVIYKNESGKLEGKRFGLLLALHMSKYESGRDWWICQCDCGKQKEIIGKSLRSGKTNSCGCGVVRATINRNKTHGLSKHPLHSVMKNIRDRCTNPKNKDYHSYGGRGIQCEFSGLQEFVDWAICAGWQSGLTVDRIDNDGNYSVGNCRIATRSAQSRNTRRNRRVQVGNEWLCFKDAAAALGVNYLTAMDRLKSGLSTEQALGLAP